MLFDIDGGDLTEGQIEVITAICDKINNLESKISDVEFWKSRCTRAENIIRSLREHLDDNGKAIVDKALIDGV